MDESGKLTGRSVGGPAAPRRSARGGAAEPSAQTPRTVYVGTLRRSPRAIAMRNHFIANYPMPDKTIRNIRAIVRPTQPAAAAAEAPPPPRMDAPQRPVTPPPRPPLPVTPPLPPGPPPSRAMPPLPPGPPPNQAQPPLLPGPPPNWVMPPYPPGPPPPLLPIPETPPTPAVNRPMLRARIMRRRSFPNAYFSTLISPLKQTRQTYNNVNNLELRCYLTLMPFYCGHCYK